MTYDDLEALGARVAGWAAAYHRTVRDRPVRARTRPGDTLALLPAAPPEDPEPMEDVLEDLDTVVLPRLTHWQHPRFFAYFAANAAPASILADWVASALAPQCMLWQTSPAATEMETRMMEWMRDAVGLPSDFAGVIQDSASSATLAAVLTMRERALAWQGNRGGLSGHPPIRVYASAEAHSSVERAIWVAGIGSENLVRVPARGPMRAMDPDALRAAIAGDRAAGRLPAGIVACTGATGMGACDDIAAIRTAAPDLFLHVDAAWAGAAMICPEFRQLWEGAGAADSVVLNPHKWLGAQFDCSAHFVRAPDDLRRTLAIRPEYLRTHAEADVTDYSEWSVPLGRRFRALKLWFLFRAYGLRGLRRMIRDHVAWSHELCEAIRALPRFEIASEPVLSLFSFRMEGTDEDNQRLVDAINDDGRVYLTQTVLDGRKVIRVQAGQFACTREDVMEVARVLPAIAAQP